LASRAGGKTRTPFHLWECFPVVIVLPAAVGRSAFKEASTRKKRCRAWISQDDDATSRVAGELTKHAKGRILLDLRTVSTRSPHSLQTVGMMLTATWLNTILGVLYGTRLGGRRRRQRSAACRPRGDRSHPQSRQLTSRWTRSAPDRTGSPGAGGAAGGPGRAGLGGGPGWPFWPPLRWRWPLSCWLRPVGMPGTW
jgi:hypothetical protein